MNMVKFSEASLERCESPRGFGRGLETWSLSDWMTATLGELGEAANVIKKLNRHRDGTRGNAIAETEEALTEQLADELADAFIYLDLLARRAGIVLQDAVIRKFNKTSEKIGYPLVLLKDGSTRV